uniref:CUB domain-containing protein n=1 Tax=Ciona intestinalis TaxID=7719 RepID=F6RF02_CIOIN
MLSVHFLLQSFTVLLFAPKGYSYNGVKCNEDQTQTYGNFYYYYYSLYLTKSCSWSFIPPIESPNVEHVLLINMYGLHHGVTRSPPTVYLPNGTKFTSDLEHENSPPCFLLKKTHQTSCSEEQLKKYDCNNNTLVSISNQWPPQINATFGSITLELGYLFIPCIESTPQKDTVDTPIFSSWARKYCL